MLKNMSRDASPALEDDLAAVLELTTASMATTRTLISELNPSALREGDLPTALAWLVEHMKSRHGLVVSLHLAEGSPHIPDVPKGLAVLLVQCVQELLFNVVKHAQAQSAVIIVRYEQGLQLEVKDDGVGFDTSTVGQDPLQPERFGLRSVGQRLEAFGGRVSVSSAPGDGTRVAIEVPLD